MANVLTLQRQPFSGTQRKSGNTFLQQTPPPYPAPVQPTVPFNDSFGSSMFVALLSTIVIEARDKTFILTGLLAATKMRRAVACGALITMAFLTLVDGLIGYVFVPLIRDKWVNWAAVIAYCAFFWLYLKDWWNFKQEDIPDSLRQPLLDSQGGYQPTNQPADQPPAANCNQGTPGQPQSTAANPSTDYVPTMSKEERRARWIDLFMKAAALIFLGEWSDATMISTSDLSMKNNFWGVQTGCLLAYCITTTVAVFAARWLGSKLRYRRLLLLTAIIFLLFAVFTVLY